VRGELGKAGTKGGIDIAVQNLGRGIDMRISVVDTKSGSHGALLQVSDKGRLLRLLAFT
jgi:hypothetical protein